MNGLFLRGCAVAVAVLAPLLVAGGGRANAAVSAAVSTDVTADNGLVLPAGKPGSATRGFLQIHNAGADDTLTGWSCPVAEVTLLAGADGKALTSLAIPAGQTVTLSAAGPHLVLENTHFAIGKGSVVPCALTFTAAGQIGVYLNSAGAPN